MFSMISLGALCSLFFLFFFFSGVADTTLLTVAHGAQGVVVFHALADDPPLGEDGVWADGAHVEGAPRSHQVVGADVTLAAPDGKVPVGQSECGVS